MTTVREVLDEVSSKVHSFTQVRESLTSLTTTLDTTMTTFTVADPERISVGLVEVDDELMYVNTVDGPTVYLFPFGRGYESTAAAEHASGAKVTNDPLYPRGAIMRALQAATAMCAPDLFKADWLTFSRADGPRGQFTLPDGTSGIRQVQLVNPGMPPQPAGSWQFMPGTTPSLLFFNTCPTQLNVLVTSDVLAPVTADDVIEDLGWVDGIRDVVVWAACWQLLQSQEPGRLDASAVAQMVSGDAVPFGSASKVAQQFYAGFAQRKMDTLRALNRKYPIQLHRKVW